MPPNLSSVLTATRQTTDVFLMTSPTTTENTGWLFLSPCFDNRFGLYPVERHHNRSSASNKPAADLGQTVSRLELFFSFSCVVKNTHILVARNLKMARTWPTHFGVLIAINPNCDNVAGNGDLRFVNRRTSE